MTTPTGPGTPNTSPFTPVVMVQLTISTADLAMSTYFTSGLARRVIPQASGTIYLQLDGDTAAQSYVATAGTPIDGQIVLVGGSTNYSGTSSIKINLLT